jgi:hypothetical protein
VTLTAQYTPDGFKVTGTITRSDNGAPIGYVTVSYTIDGGSVEAVTTLSNGTYSIPVPNGATFEITGITRAGYQTAYTDPYTWPFTVNDNIYNIDFQLVPMKYDVTVTITVESDGGGTFEYSNDYGVTWIPVTTMVAGNHVIPNVSYDTPIWIRAIPANAGNGVVWNDAHPATRQVGDFKGTVAAGDMFLTVKFTPAAADDGDDMFLLLLLLPLAILALALMFFLFWGRGSQTAGTVRKDGKGAAGVKIEYTVDGKTNVTKTNGNGEYRIRAKEGSEVTIASVTKEGYTVSEKLPVSFIMQKNGKMTNFSMTE